MIYIGIYLGGELAVASEHPDDFDVEAYREAVHELGGGDARMVIVTEQVYLDFGLDRQEEQ